MSVFKIEKNNNYTVMSNYHLRDHDLSYKAKGLLSFMLSLPEDWDYSLAGLCSISKESRDGIRSILKELQEHHYVEIEKVRGDKGYFEYNYLIYEIPHFIDLEKEKKKKFIDGKEIDLRKDGAYVQWIRGYTVDGDWTMRLWGREFKSGKEIFRFSNVDGDIIFVSYATDTTQCWFEMRAKHNDWLWGYVTESSHIALPTDTEQMFCWLRKIGNLYELKIESRGVES